MSRLSRDAILYDDASDSSIEYITKVTAENAVPNTLKTRKEFDGFFVKKVEYLEGNFLFDPHLASYVSSNYENFSDIKNDIFICLVFVPELHHINRDTLPKEPSGEEFDKLVEKLLASRKGVFKKYDYEGEEPAYLAPVKVSFADTDGFTDPLFETPLAGGAAAVGGGGVGAGGVVGTCGAGGSVNTTVGNANNGNNTVTKKQQEVAQPASADIVVTEPEMFLSLEQLLIFTSTDDVPYSISFLPDLPFSLEDVQPFDQDQDTPGVGMLGIDPTENAVAELINAAINKSLAAGFTSEIVSLKGDAAPSVNAPSTGEVLRTADCDFEKFNSDYINYKNGAYVIFVPKEFNPELPINVMLWFHGNGGLGGKEAIRAAKVINEGPGLPKGENRIFIAPSLGSKPGSIKGTNVSNPVVKPEFLEDAVTSLYLRLFPGDPSTGAPGPVPVIQTIRGYGWSAGGSPLSQFFANYIEKYGLEKIKIIRYLDADYGNKDHINFAKKLKELLEAGAQGANFAQTWNSIVSFVVQTKGKPGSLLAKPLEYSWVYADKGYIRKGNKERHDMVYPQGVSVYVLNVGHTQCGWQTADYIDTAAAGSTGTSSTSQEAKIKITQKIAGAGGNGYIQHLAGQSGITFTEFTGGKDLPEEAAPKEPTTPSPQTPGTAGSVPAPAPKQEPEKIPEDEVSGFLKIMIDSPHPTGDFDPAYVRLNPISVLKAARAYGLEIPDRLLNILSISRYWNEVTNLLKKSEAEYFSNSRELNPISERPPTFGVLGGTDAAIEGKKAEEEAVLKISEELLIPFLKDLAGLVYPGPPPSADPTAPGGPAAPPVPAPTPAKPSEAEVNTTTPSVSQPAQAQPGSNVCAQAGMVGAGGTVGPPTGGSVPVGGSATAGSFPAGEPLEGYETIKTKKLFRDMAASGRFAQVAGTDGKKRGWGFNAIDGTAGGMYPEGNLDSAANFGQTYTLPSVSGGTKGLKTVWGISADMPLNSMYNLGQEYMRGDAATAGNAVGKEIRSKGGIFMFDSCGRPWKPTNTGPGNHTLGLAIDLPPSVAMCDPLLDIYAVTVDFVYKNRVYWRVYSLSRGFSGVDAILAKKSSKNSLNKLKDEWYAGDSQPGNQVPNITINAAFIRTDPVDKVSKLYFAPVTGPFFDITEIFQRHGFTPIGAKDSASHDCFWGFRKKQFAEYGITEQTIPQGLPLKGYKGSEWWHFEFLKNNVKSDTAAGQLMRRYGGRSGVRKNALKQGAFKAAAKAKGQTVEEYVDGYWFPTVFAANERRTASLSKVARDKKGLTVYGGGYY